MQDILSYLAAEYDPVAIIVYGSFADGTSNLFSDFDALLMTADGARRHDDRFVDCTQLDVFVHPLSDFQGDYDPAEYARIYGGQILLDRDGIAAALLERVRCFVDGQAKKTAEELRLDLSWCEKMLRRAERTDAEGCFRRHWLLVDSLEIYTALRGWPYLGPKKALGQLEKKDKAAYALYETALTAGDYASLAAWIGQLRERFEKLPKKRKQGPKPRSLSSGSNAV